MAAPVLQSISTVAEASGTSLAMNAPSGVASGDFLLAVVASENRQQASTPSGWDLVHYIETSVVNLGQTVFRRIATGGADDTPTISFPGSAALSGIILRINGQAASSPFDTSNSAASGFAATLAVPTATVAENDSLCVLVTSSISQSLTCSVDNSWSEFGEYPSSTTGIAAYRQTSAAGTSPGGTITWSSSTRFVASVVIIRSVDQVINPTYQVGDLLLHESATRTHQIGMFLFQEQVAVAGGDTFTATIALTTGGVEFSAIAEFDPPVFSSTSDLDVGGTLFDADAEFDDPVFSATTTLNVGGTEFAATAEFDVLVPGTFAATADLDVGGSTFDADAEFDVPVFSGSGTFEVGGTLFDADAEFDDPVYSASSDLTIGGVEFSSNAAFAADVFSATITGTTGGVEFSGTGEFDPPVYSAEVNAIAGGTVIASSAEFDDPVFSATVAVTTGTTSTSVAATFTGLQFSAAVSVAVGGVSITSAAEFTSPVFSATLAVTIGGAEFASLAFTNDVPSYITFVDWRIDAPGLIDAEVTKGTFSTARLSVP